MFHLPTKIGMSVLSVLYDKHDYTSRTLAAPFRNCVFFGDHSQYALGAWAAIAAVVTKVQGFVWKQTSVRQRKQPSRG